MKTNSIKKAFFTAKRFCHVYSPEIKVGIGIVSMLVGTVTASVSSTKLEDTMTQLPDKESIDVCDFESSDEYYKAIAQIQAEKIVAVSKLYWLPAVITIGGAFLIINGHADRYKRFVGVSGALATVSAAYASYRTTVSDKYGKDVDEEIYEGLSKTEVSHTNEKGKKVKADVWCGSEGESPYARMFDESNSNWFEDPENSLLFLRSQEAVMNERLQKRGYLLLNDVYKALDYPETKAGCIVGWIYDPDNFSKKNPDSFVSFGLDDGRRASRAFINKEDNIVLLDFNVDGNIMSNAPLENI